MPEWNPENEQPADRLFKLLESKLEQLFPPRQPDPLPPFVVAHQYRFRAIQDQEGIARIAVELLKLPPQYPGDVGYRNVSVGHLASVAACIWRESCKQGDAVNDDLEAEKAGAVPLWQLLRRTANAGWCDAWRAAHPEIPEEQIVYPVARMDFLNREYPAIDAPAVEASPAPSHGDS